MFTNVRYVVVGITILLAAFNSTFVSCADPLPAILAKKLSALKLFREAMNGNIDNMEQLIREEGINVNIKDDLGWTAMHFAAMSGQLDVVKS